MLKLGIDDGVHRLGLVATRLADAPLVRSVAPAGAVRDEVAVVASQEPADDRADGVDLLGRGVDEAGTQVVPEPEVAAHGLFTALLLFVAAFALGLGGVV